MLDQFETHTRSTTDKGGGIHNARRIVLPKVHDLLSLAY